MGTYRKYFRRAHHDHQIRQPLCRHVDLENIGYGGTPINDRRYDNEHLSTALFKAEPWR